MGEMNMVQALNSAFKSIMKEDGSIVVYGEDVGVDGGVFRVTDGLQKEFGEKRVFDSPLAEGGIAGTALGMAMHGMKPVVEMQFSGFIYPGFQQIVSHISRMRNRTRGTLTAPLVIRTPYGGGVNALEHHSESLEAVFVHVPGLKVVIPSNPYDAKGLLIAAIKDPDPVLFLEPKRLYRAVKMDVPDEAFEEEIGKAKVKQEGKDITIIAWGGMVPVAEDAISQVDASCELIDLRTIDPWDKKTVMESVKKTGRCVVIHEATKTVGFAAEIAATIQEEELLNLKAPVGRVTAPDVIVPYFKAENFYRPNADMLVKRIKEVMSF